MRLAIALLALDAALAAVLVWLAESLLAQVLPALAQVIR